MRTLSKDTASKIGESVILMGWVASRRDHGKLIFIDLRDRWGMAQVVFNPKDEMLLKEADRLRSEWVVKIEGLVKERPKGMENPELPTGGIEIEAKSLEILAEAKTPPFALDTDGYEIGEEHRLKYRYLDLRRPRLAKNLMMRDKVIAFIRNWLHQRDFVEIETPILTKSTPEGARDYVVPSRLYPGKFYALPQSPQQYKQLLMVAGLERYFQIAHCFRDEDTRGDRQPEFTQLDLEMSFVEREDVMALNEELLIALVRAVAPDKRIQGIPFPRLSYQEVIEKYGTDRPDLREDKNDPNLFAFCWIYDFPFFEKTDEDKWTFTHNPFSAPVPEYKLEQFWDQDNKISDEEIRIIKTSQYDIVLNGSEIGGGSIRSRSLFGLFYTFRILGYTQEEIQKKFFHIFRAFESGVPPHGGIAWGLDRLIMLLLGEPNIREVIAFPKTGDARDLMMDAPSELDEKQLQEFHVKIDG